MWKPGRSPRLHKGSDVPLEGCRAGVSVGGGNEPGGPQRLPHRPGPWNSARMFSRINSASARRPVLSNQSMRRFHSSISPSGSGLALRRRTTGVRAGVATGDLLGVSAARNDSTAASGSHGVWRMSTDTSSTNTLAMTSAVVPRMLISRRSKGRDPEGDARSAVEPRRHIARDHGACAYPRPVDPVHAKRACGRCRSRASRRGRLSTEPRSFRAGTRAHRFWYVVRPARFHFGSSKRSTVKIGANFKVTSWLIAGVWPSARRSRSMSPTVARGTQPRPPGRRRTKAGRSRRTRSTPSPSRRSWRRRASATSRSSRTTSSRAGWSRPRSTSSTPGSRSRRSVAVSDQMATHLRLLRPGGTLVLEEWDVSSWHLNPPAPAAGEADRAHRGGVRALRRRHVRRTQAARAAPQRRHRRERPGRDRGAASGPPLSARAVAVRDRIGTATAVLGDGRRAGAASKSTRRPSSRSRAAGARPSRSCSAGAGARRSSESSR